MITRICGPGRDVHSRTRRVDVRFYVQVRLSELKHTLELDVSRKWRQFSNSERPLFWNMSVREWPTLRKGGQIESRYD